MDITVSSSKVGKIGKSLSSFVNLADIGVSDLVKDLSVAVCIHS